MRFPGGAERPAMNATAGFLPFALYRRFALQKTRSSDHQQG